MCRYIAYTNHGTGIYFKNKSDCIIFLKGVMYLTHIIMSVLCYGIY